MKSKRGMGKKTDFATCEESGIALGGRSKTPLFLVLASSLLAGLMIPTPTLAGVGKSVSDVCRQSKDAAFRAKYCSAAKDLKQGFVANQTTSAVWSGVAVACGVACGKAVGGIVCKGANIGGTAGEGVITKKFSDAIAGEGMKYGGEALAGKDTANAAETTVNAAKVDADACQTAGKSALKAYEKLSNSKQNEKSLTQLRDQTKEMNTIGQNVSIFSSGDTQPSGVSNDANTAAASAGKKEVCDEASVRTALGAIRCAASADPHLPPYLKSEAFLEDLKKATGKSPDEFFAAFESPAKSIFDSPLVAGLSEGQQRDLADSLSAMEGYSEKKAATLAAKNSDAPEYSSGARGSIDNDTGFDMNEMIAGVLGQLGGAEDGKAGAPEGGEQLVLRRKIASNTAGPEDRKISLFDRVKWRYGAVSLRDHLGEK